jgi:hypothetical protein
MALGILCPGQSGQNPSMLDMLKGEPAAQIVLDAAGHVLSTDPRASCRPLLRDNQNRSPSDNLPYIRWWSSVWRASWCQARSRQRREPKGLGFTAVCLPDIIIAGCSFRWMKLSSVSEA